MYLLIAIAAVLFVFVIVTMFRSQTDTMNYVLASAQERFEQEQAGGGKRATLVFMHMKGCGWCERFNPTWDEFKTKHGGRIDMAKIERSDPSAKKYAEHVSGYPTILLVTSDEKVIKFSGERTIQGLEEFLANNGVEIRESFFNFVPKGSSRKVVKENMSGDDAAKKIAKLRQSIVDNAMPSVKRQNGP
jgi:thiol-disulfide isomerase/thioredoxin